MYDVGFTARVSNGLNISCFGVGDGIHETRDVALGMMDPANSVSVHFEHEEKYDWLNAGSPNLAVRSCSLR